MVKADFCGYEACPTQSSGSTKQAHLCCPIFSKARRLKRREGNIDLVVVDHAGLIEAGGENRQNAKSTVARALKGLAKELSCPVIALCAALS